MRKVLLTATVQSHICQFHKPLIAMLRQQGDVEIHVAARDNLSEKNGLKLDFADKVFDIPFSRSPLNKNNIKAYKSLKNLINREKYDIIHCNTPMGGVLTRLAAKKARKSGCKVVYTAHGFHFYKGSSKKSWLIYYNIEKFLARKTDVIITINKEDFAIASERFSCKVAHIHGVGVDPKRYCPANTEEKASLKEKLGLNADKRYILCVGELLPNKEQSVAIKAMKTVIKSFPDAVLLLAGNGPEKDNLEALISECNLGENVSLIGYVTNLEEYQKVSEIAVSCSKREGLPLNPIEAMLTGNPVVATKNRGHNELVIDGLNGYLIDIGDTDALAQKLIVLLGDNCGLNQKEIMDSVKSYTSGVVSAELKEIYLSNIFSK